MKKVSPGLLKMALSLLETVRDVANAEGKLLATKEEQAERFAVCLECEELLIPEMGKGAARCCECGCFLQYKISISASKCPLQRWPGSH